MTEVLDTEWVHCFLDPHSDPELEARYRRETGFLPPGIEYLGARPWLLVAGIDFDIRLGNLVHLEQKYGEIIAFVVSQDNVCRYCFAGRRLILGFIGFSPEHIQRLEEGQLAIGGDPAEQLVAQFARRLSRADPPLMAEDLRRLQDAGFSWDAVREMALTGANWCAATRISTFGALPPQTYEHAPKTLRFRLVAPLLARRFKSRTRPGTPDSFADELEDMPFADFVRSFDGLPLGRAYKNAMEAIWNSDVLSRRACLLIFAVVARAMRCPLSEREVNQFLLQEGLDADDISDILTNLASPKLDALETLLVPAARETVWYEPSHVQRRMKALHADIGNQRFLEFAGVAAYANMTCRLAALAR